MQYGQFLLSLKSCDESDLCIIRGLEPILSSNGDPILNELDCPLMILTQTIFVTKSSSILGAVSIICECSGSCKFARRQYETSIEREELCLSSTRTE